MQDIFDDEIIKAGQICAKSGLYSFKSFEKALELCIEYNASLVTLPIHKYAWQLAGIEYVDIRSICDIDSKKKRL